MRMHELQEIGDRACFVPFGTFHRSLDLSWLKPYLILTDYVALESRATLEYYARGWGHTYTFHIVKCVDVTPSSPFFSFPRRPTV